RSCRGSNGPGRRRPLAYHRLSPGHESRPKVPNGSDGYRYAGAPPRLRLYPFPPSKILPVHRSPGHLGGKKTCRPTYFANEYACSGTFVTRPTPLRGTIIGGQWRRKGPYANGKRGTYEPSFRDGEQKSHPGHGGVRADFLGVEPDRTAVPHLLRAPAALPHTDVDPGGRPRTRRFARPCPGGHADRSLRR